MPGPRVSWFVSPREVEAFLASRLADLTQEGSLPEPPALVVVPSRSVREGLVQSFLRRRKAWLGVEVRTLQGVAYAVLERAGIPFLAREELVPVVVARVAQAFAGDFRPFELVASLRNVQPLVSTVRDLLDAGFTAAHLDAALELTGSELEEPAREKAEAVLRVAAAVHSTLQADGISRRNDALSLATDLLKTRGTSVWSQRLLFLYGFADVTGLAADFLEALLAVSGGEAILVRPPDPVDPEQGAGEAFLSRLQQRLGAVAPPPPATSQLPEWRVWRAPELESEVRWVAEDIKKRLAQGATPERLGVVARGLGPYALAIRKHFSALGVPFSAYQPAPVATPLGTRLSSLLNLAAKGFGAPLSEMWAALPRTGEEPSSSLLQALAGVVGARTLGQLVDRGGACLQENETAPGLGAGEREAVRDWLESLRETLASPSGEETAVNFASRVRALGKLLDPAGSWEGVLERGLEAFENLAGNLALTREEWCFVLERKLQELLWEPLGGNGGGVAVLSAMEARFRTFDHLYVLGLQRDVFPRVPREDPLLPDAVRRKLSALLPDIPLAERGASEERYLFGLLLASAPSVWLSWPASDPDGRPLARSPFLDELLVANPGLCEERVPGREALVVQGTARPATPGEWAVYAGMHEDRKGWRAALTLALEEAAAEVGGPMAPAAEKIAEAREKVLREWAPPPWEAERRALSPYLGFLGTSPWVDEATAMAAVTTMEAYAQCPWKTFVERVLRVRNPFAVEREGKDIAARLLGDVVHGVLERILDGYVQDQKRRRREGVEAVGEPLRWPEPRALERLVGEVTEKRLRQVGVVYPGLMLAVRTAALPYLEAARRFLLDPPRGEIFSGEGSGWMGDGSGFPSWHFRFDAALRIEGCTVLLDFKTGNPDGFLQGKTDLEGQVRRGKLLQGAIYAAASRGVGCYVFLKPQWEGDRELPIEYSAALEKAVRATFRRFYSTARLGVFFPRLLDPKDRIEPDTCERCGVRLACSRGESGARRRLQQWGERFPGPGRAEEAAWRHWWLKMEK